MTVAYGNIARVLAGARRRQIRVVLSPRSASGSHRIRRGLAGALAIFWGARIGLRPVVLAGAGTAIVAAIVLAVRALLRTAWTAEAAARTVARDEPALRSTSCRRSSSSASATTSRRAGGTRSRSWTRTSSTPRRGRFRWTSRARCPIAGHGAGFALAAVAAITRPPSSRRRPRARLRSRAPRRSAGHAGAGRGSITGDIQLTYQYPAYMKREPRTLSGTGGRSARRRARR
jgi:hypothetical protein